LKYDRESHAPHGRTGTASVSYRNWRTIDGVQIPMTIETGAEGGNAAETIVIDDVTLNPSLSDAHFEKPTVLEGHKPQRDLRSAFPAAATFRAPWNRKNEVCAAPRNGIHRTRACHCESRVCGSGVGVCEYGDKPYRA